MSVSLTASLFLTTGRRRKRAATDAGLARSRPGHHLPGQQLQMPILRVPSKVYARISDSLLQRLALALHSCNEAYRATEVFKEAKKAMRESPPINYSLDDWPHTIVFC